MYLLLHALIIYHTKQNPNKETAKELRKPPQLDRVIPRSPILVAGIIIISLLFLCFSHFRHFSSKPQTELRSAQLIITQGHPLTPSLPLPLPLLSSQLLPLLPILEAASVPLPSWHRSVLLQD